MEGRVGAIPRDSGWSSDRPPNHASPRKKKPASPPVEEQPGPSAPAEDYYAPSEPDEEA